MAKSLRKNLPCRRQDVRHRSRYQDYKAELRADFSQRCGYCDDHDRTFGNQRGYHIDHFAPKSLYASLTTIYSNLVYACPICNMAKSNKWYGASAENPVDGHRGFVDPCSEDFDVHLGRTNDGEIVGLTALGHSIVDDLKLGLLRHQLNWQLEALDEMLGRLIHLSRDIAQRGIRIDSDGIFTTLSELKGLIDEVQRRRDA